MPPMWCLPTVELLDASLPLPRVLAGQVPRLHRYYQGTATSCRPSRRTSFPSLGGTAGALRFRLPGAEECVPAEPGVGHPVSPAGTSSAETAGSPKFLGNLDCPFAMFLDSGRTAGPRPLWDRSVALGRGTAKAPARNRLSKLDRMAFGLAAYASQRRLPKRRARLASRCWSGSPGRAFHPQGSAERFPKCSRYIPSSFPKLAWRNPHLCFRVTKGHRT